MPVIAFTAEPVKESIPSDVKACTLVLEGKPIDNLILVDPQGLLYKFSRPNSTLSLPPGRYLIREIAVRWDENGYPSTDRDVNCLTLSPNYTCILKFGENPSLKLSVNRQGNLLAADCFTYIKPNSLVNTTNDIHPLIAVYQGEEKLASGPLKYG